ncbi:hypothetical protein A2972_02595 [Candidatus Amesbacteria bacterium RIFCSPLOWO2_01_FULL_47_33]|uniref:Uncharacterized protein n=1 Tax=Candidatus Amesbacteria bacterium RIFCSPLOWO2_01_FULL_47_33 TaxID=1797258 RepID=A0A1F4Z4S6_9BACT|nr:MAG: hypothetical protein A2972_02595 [Candidatus Amesbacteria bacterium RIFCSPLOWO2_01_FULL_47_33]
MSVEKKYHIDYFGPVRKLIVLNLVWEEVQKLAKREVGKQEFGVWLARFYANTGEARYLEKEQKQLGNMSPLAFMRRKADLFQTQQIIKDAPLPFKDAARFLKVADREFRRFPSRKTARDLQPSKGFVPLREAKDLQLCGSDTRTVHLSRQEVFNAKILKRLLEICPNLERVQYPPSFDRLMRYNRGILENAGVSVIAARQFDMAYYDESIGPGGFEEKNRIFQKITKERRREFRQMIELEIPEALLAEAYFESNGNKTIAEIAGETGLPTSFVSRKIRILLHWGGYLSMEKSVKSGAMHLEGGLKRLIRATEDMKFRLELRESHRVGSFLPPENLPIQAWEMWETLANHWRSNPKAYQRLESAHPDWYEILSDYYGLKMLGGERETSTHIAKRLGFSGREKVKQIVNKAISFLDVELEKK